VIADRRFVVAIAGVLPIAAGCAPPPDCVSRWGEYHYDDLAMLRLCRVTAFDGACPDTFPSWSRRAAP
jgi:hypothetical protein